MFLWMYIEMYLHFFMPLCRKTNDEALWRVKMYEISPLQLEWIYSLTIAWLHSFRIVALFLTSIFSQKSIVKIFKHTEMLKLK